MKKESMLGTLDKALKINLDSSVYGAFAEIGAGQETANWFFKASGAAGTVAKSISAYDMTVSDSLYGPAKRYVSKERLIAMMDAEYHRVEERLASTRGDHTCFFSFCNTVKAKGYKDNGHWHGWLGLKFQMRPKSAPSEVIIHVRLNDPDHDSQMHALGILGVNLIHAVFYKRDNMRDFVESLVDNIRPGSVEVDLLTFEGAGFQMMDNRLFALQLVESGLTDASMFLPEGTIVPAADILYKKPVVLMRGSFAPVTNLNLEMLQSTKSCFAKVLSPEASKRCVEICEITVHNLLRGGRVDHLEFLDRADALQALGKMVMITRYPRFDGISEFLSRFTSEPIAISLSVGLINELFKEKWYADLPGGILESFGRLFKNRTELYVYPWKNRQTGEIVTADNFIAPENLSSLYAYFQDNNLIHAVPHMNEDMMRYTARDIQKMIASGDDQWKQYVPEVAHRSALHL